MKINFNSLYSFNARLDRGFLTNVVNTAKNDEELEVIAKRLEEIKRTGDENTVISYQDDRTTPDIYVSNIKLTPEEAFHAVAGPAEHSENKYLQALNLVTPAEINAAERHLFAIGAYQNGKTPEEYKKSITTDKVSLNTIFNILNYKQGRRANNFADRQQHLFNKYNAE
ncbi:MAG: hypothetical protein LBK53_07910 [Heliobacteriaceae bacterium]|jgi:hypothetical protein|nr:hypothetical protein [Heliobacteriaceae bacterium]